MVKDLCFLFTPYGYKFEGRNDDGVRIYEKYGSSGVELPRKRPWKIVMNGVVDLTPGYDGLRSIGENGLYWGRTTFANTDNIFYLTLLPWDLYPSNYDGRRYAISVRVYYFVI